MNAISKKDKLSLGIRNKKKMKIRKDKGKLDAMKSLKRKFTKLSCI